MKRLQSIVVIAALVFIIGNNLFAIELLSDKMIKCYNGINFINETDHKINISFDNENWEIDNKVLFFGNIDNPKGYTLTSGSSLNTFDSKNKSSSLYLGMGGTGSNSLSSDFGTKANPVLIDIIVKLKDVKAITDKVEISFFTTKSQTVTAVCAEMKNGKDSINIFEDTINVSIEPAGYAGAMHADSLTIDCDNLFTIKFTQLKHSSSSKDNEPTT